MRIKHRLLKSKYSGLLDRSIFLRLESSRVSFVENEKKNRVSESTYRETWDSELMLHGRSVHCVDVVIYRTCNRVDYLQSFEWPKQMKYKKQITNKDRYLLTFSYLELAIK